MSIDPIDLINHAFSRISDIERAIMGYGQRDKIVLPGDFSLYVFPAWSTPVHPDFRGYMANIEVMFSQAPTTALLLSVLLGNESSTVSETEVWTAGFPAGSRKAQYLFPTPIYSGAYPYGALTGYQESPLIDPENGDYVRLGVRAANSGIDMSGFIDFAPAKAFAP
jgi:hypothetical protein